MSLTMLIATEPATPTVAFLPPAPEVAEAVNEFIGVPVPVIPALTRHALGVDRRRLAGGRLDRCLVRGIGQVQGHCRADADLILPRGVATGGRGGARGVGGAQVQAHRPST